MVDALRTNGCLNPSFEIDTIGLSHAGSTGSWNTTEHYVGGACAEIDVNSANDGAFMVTDGYGAPVNPGEVWTMSAYVKGPAGEHFYPQWDWNTDPARATQVAFTGPHELFTGDWQRTSITFTAPATCAVAGIGIKVSEPYVGAFYMDALQYENSPYATPYFDGDTPASGGFSYAWLGARGLSASIEYVTPPPYMNPAPLAIPAGRPDVTLSAWDINSNQLITQITGATGRTYSVRLNDSGEFSFSMDLTDGTTSAQSSRLLAYGGNPFKVIFSEGDAGIQYVGIAWTTHRSSSSIMLEVAGKALPSYLEHVASPHSYTTTISPLLLLAQVVTDAQTIQSAAIGLTPVPMAAASPSTITPSYAGNQYVMASQIVNDITGATVPGEGGVDWYETDVFQDGVPQHFLNIVAPRAGVDSTRSKLSVDLSRTIHWDWPQDASQAGNQAIVVGSGSGAVQPVSVKNASVGRGGIGEPPMLQKLYQASQLTTQSQLDAAAHGLAQLNGEPVTVPTATIPYDYPACRLGDFGIGDDVLVKSHVSAWFPGGLSVWKRIVAYTVTYPDQGIPTVSLTFNTPPFI